MKLGAENRNKTIFAVVLAAIAIVLVGRIFVTGGVAPAPTSGSNTQQQQQAVTGRRRTKAVVVPPPSASLDPRLRLDLLKASENNDYKGSGRDIFRAEAAPVIPKPIVPPDNGRGKNTPPPIPQPPPQPVTPPPAPINLKFFGFANRPGEPTKVFLAQGEEVFVAAEGQTVKGRYKVLRITPNSVEVQDVLTNNPPQTIPLTQG